MAEADAFIFAALKQSKWLEGSSESTSWTVSDLSSDEFIVLVLKFVARLQDVDGNKSLDPVVPAVTAPVGVAARHRVGSKLANTLKELGYAGECGYNHFLYPNEKETRNILSWLVGKLPRSEVGENENNDSKSDVLDTMGKLSNATGWQKNLVLDSEQLSNIFLSWKREKTLPMLPNQNVKGLKGFQRLPLQTSPLELPWSRLGKTTRNMFEGFPEGSVKITSLLEALSVAKRSNTILLREDDLEEEIESVGIEPNEKKDDGVLKGDGQVAGENGSFALQGAQNEDDDFAAIQPQSFVATALPDVPTSLDSSSSTGLFVTESLSVESTGFSNVDTSEREQKRGTEDLKGDKEQSIETLQKELHDTERRIAAMRKVLDHERGELHQVEQHIIEAQSTGQLMQKQLARQKQVVAMLPQAQSNIAKLEEICKTSAVKKDAIARQTEVAREPLLQEYAELKGQKSRRKARCRQLVREIKAFRTEMQELTSVIYSKLERMQALEKVQERQMEKLNKQKDMTRGPMTRNMYTSRIMDITKQVYKQRQDIAKILEDIKGLQKQLNAASEKLKRTEAVAEEKLYGAASKSKNAGSTKTEAYVECYRKFAQLRELFEELIAVITDLGKKENAARDLRNSISQLEARESSNHLDKVLADLDSVRKENGTLQNELRTRLSC
ncbi:unnamed protein product [Peronospora belbahrii]|uniref:Coiled-coil domain-containing protein 22 homolog n=1 Tax=Peronospora belbahrii TaxID=622444 RepID=A0AAU9KY51_9STRA|nr:unnamed protein product [Peronospora belbahrii]CAH0518304.1 unnamed protein product [Peronospora belbahrii]